MRLFLLALAVLLCYSTAAAPAAYEWRKFHDDPSQVSLWKDGTQIGNLRIDDGKFFKLVRSGVWSESCECPIEVPSEYRKPKPKPAKDTCPNRCCGLDCTCPTGRNCQKPNCHCVLPSLAVVDRNGIANYGVDMKEIAAGKHSINGRDVSRKKLIEALTAGVDVPSDENLLFVTVIGPEAARQQVLADLESNPGVLKFKGQYRVQSYAPDHWAVQDAGFFTGGSPTIYMQAPDGTVLHRQDTYNGPDDLALTFSKVLGNLRDKNPNYDSSKDPDVTKSAIDWLKSLPPYVWVIGGLLVLFSLLRNQPSK